MPGSIKAATLSNNGKISVPGFKAGAVKAGVRYKGRLDLGLILSEYPCPAAGVFTQNRVKAPSVILSKRRLKKGIAQAVLVNSGNANTCVGQRGMKDAEKCTAALAEALGVTPGLALMNSTGVIGEPLPQKKIIASLPALVKRARPEGLDEFARAIMTTDTAPKLAARRVKLGKGRVTIAGIAKGAGMVMPNMATMLAYIISDAHFSPAVLNRMLAGAVDDTFNSLTIDGDTSTSDSVIMMTSGASRIRPEALAKNRRAFSDALNDLCLELTTALAADGEGATKWFKVTVLEARSKKEADRVARRVANSPLVKTAFHAADPNWGRVMMAVGSAGVPINPDRVDVIFKSEKGLKVQVVQNGARAKAYSEPKAVKILSGTGFTVKISLNRGKGTRTIHTCDFSAEYVKINADYRT
jgi:glutamate N-acetyltransferase/amino-acid N-acetyltransferase